MSNVTDQIKERVDIVEFISAYVPLRKAGRNFVGFCPFHPNTRTPAFTVFPDTQSYHCFGCKASGTVFDFLMQREGLEFRDALEQLAQRAGVELRPRTSEDEQRDQLRTRLLEINTAAAVFFHHLLVSSKQGTAARAYVAGRGIDAATIESFQLGYAPAEWSALLAYLADKKGFEPAEVAAAGLAIEREQGGYYDRFRDRLMFPIRNPKGEVIAFGGRALGDAHPKYMNSPQTPLFDKGRVLYGLDMARDAIRSSETVVIVEGYVDVIVAHQYGFRNVVAPLGTALTPDHVEVLKHAVRRIRLALDADAAGLRATLKGVETLHENLGGREVPVPTPYGFVRWERELEAEIGVIVLPEGRDPDEVIRADPQLWHDLVEQAQPVMDFYITALTSDLDLASARGKATTVQRLAPLLARIANPVEQAHYIQQVARFIGVDETSVRAALPTPGRSARARRPAPPPSVAPGSAPTREDYLLGWLLRYPSAATAVQEKLRRDLEPYALVADLIDNSVTALFERVENRLIWQAWVASGANDDAEAWAQTLDEPLREQALRTLHLGVPEPQGYRYVNDALECATILQLRLALRWKDRLSQQQAHSDTNDADLIDSIERLVQIKEYIDAISTPKRSSTYDDLHALRAQ